MKKAFALILTFMSLAACGQSPPPPPPSPIPLPATEVSGTDLAWAQLQLALNKRALEILQLVPGKAGDSRLAPFAAGLASRHQAENVRLDELLQRIGAPEGNPHEGHNMPGMATPEQIASMSQVRGDPFDQLFVARMREHLQQCQSLARSMQSAGTLPAATELARSIETSRDTDLRFLSTWPT